MKTVPPEFYTLLPLFEQKYCGRLKKFDEQRLIPPKPENKSLVEYGGSKWFFMYFEHKRFPLMSDWISHFYTSPRKVGNNYISGSLSLSGLDDTGIIKWVSIDIDDAEQMHIWKTKLKPKLDSLGYEYLIEWGGTEDENGEFDRCHVLIFYNDVPIVEVTDHIRQLFYEIDERIFATDNFNNKKVLFDEVFPINKKKNKIRPPLGAHLKRGGRRYPCEFKGQLLTDPIDVIYTIINIQGLSSDVLLLYQNNDLIQKLNENQLTFDKKLEKNSAKRPFFYKPVNLPLPLDNIPQRLQPVVKNCQAINTLLDEVKSGLINERGSMHHDAQLMLRGVTKYLNAVYRTLEGDEFYDDLRTTYRFRSDEDHHLDELKHEDNPIRYFAKCQTWHSYFGLCEGCPFFNKVGNPVRFIKGQVIERLKVGRVKLTTLDEIRNKEFPRLRSALLDNIIRHIGKNIIFRHFQGSGKSTSLVRESINDLIQKNKKVLLAVPTVELGMEYKKELKEKFGIDSFLLTSHQGHFNPEKKDTRLATDDCPFYQEIQALEKLGVSSTTYKNQYCGNCPLRESCSYPRQYTEVLDDAHKVVIMQHAHFSCQEVIYELMEKNFDVLFVDETFIDSVYKFIPIKENHITLLDTAGFEWTGRLADWLRGEHLPRQKINPSEVDLLIVKSFFEKNNVFDWVVPDFIRFYNQKRLINNNGIEVVYELPNIETKVFTDATAPIKLIEHLTGLENIEVQGKDLVLDPKSVHPDNEVIQILDFTASVTWLQDEDTFNLIIEKIAKLVNEMSPESNVVITAYLKDHRRIRKYLVENHTNLLSKIVLNGISKGINRFSNYDVQFLLANILPMPEDYFKTAYKYIQVANHYRIKNGLDTIPVPTGVEDIKTTYEAIERIEDGFVVEYPQFKIRKPVKSNDINDISYWHRLIYEYHVGNVQQALRVRLTPDKPRTIYVLNNVPLPSTLITQSMDLNTWLLS